MREKSGFRQFIDEEVFTEAWNSFLELGPADLDIIARQLDEIAADKQEFAKMRQFIGTEHLEEDWLHARRRSFIAREMIRRIALEGYPLQKLEEMDISSREGIISDWRKQDGRVKAAHLREPIIDRYNEILEAMRSPDPKQAREQVLQELQDGQFPGGEEIELSDKQLRRYIRGE